MDIPGSKFTLKAIKVQAQVYYKRRNYPHRSSKIEAAPLNQMLTVAYSTRQINLSVIRETGELFSLSVSVVKWSFFPAENKMSSQDEGADSCTEAKEDDYWVNISPYPSEGQIVSPVSKLLKVFIVFTNISHGGDE